MGRHRITRFAASAFAALAVVSASPPLMAQAQAQPVAGVGAPSGSLGSPVVLETRSGPISGSLLLPAAAKAGPVVLIIAGSGPTDRDGNSRLLPGHNDSLKMLAQALADAGFASLRYDKRTVGESVKTPERELRFETYVNDAIGWVERLQRDARFTGVVVLGHSEGSAIGMLAARQANATAFVSIAGVAQGAASILRLQLAGKLPPDLAARNEAILQSLEQGQLVDDVPAALQVFYRPSVQPYLVSWFKVVPASEFARLRMPALVLQGDTDIQVGVAEAQALKAALPQAELVIVPGMNHVLKRVPPDRAQQLKSYSDPSLPIADGLVAALLRFLSER